LVFGFMLASAVLSMWISNTATTLMLLPVALAALEGQRDDRLTVPLLLGIAYASSIGGIGTPVGTPPNVILMGVYQSSTGKEISFLEWMKIGVPVVVLFIPLAWLWLTRHLSQRRPAPRASEHQAGKTSAGDAAVPLPALGPWRSAEKRVLAVFALTALAWVTRSEPFGGWSGLIGATGVGDSTVALGAVVALFLVPSGRGDALLDWPTAAKIPWGLLILFGGGIAIARAFDESGLSQSLGAVLSALATWPVPLMLIVIALVVTFLTEVTSNTATTSLLMPILATAAAAAAVDPRLLMVPAAMSASCAFMLPVATAPNAIVFGTERFDTKVMAREGFGLNLMGTVVISGVCYLLLPR
jgi:solute carrier family 13 (sodium-dependent dicarboxylate transporter), member 2/3/5